MTSWKGSSVTIATQLLEETYQRLRSCGQRRRECHLYWIASWQNPSRIVRTAHPVHTATAVSVEIDMAWMNAFFLELADRSECIRVQVHSHPGGAFHSGTDDRWPAIHLPGFLSLVIPDFATGEPDLSGAFLAAYDALGAWNEVPLERISVEVSLAA
ncbi:MAG: hypothetical protein ACRDGM_14280 [bacterium]